MGSFGVRIASITALVALGAGACAAFWLGAVHGGARASALAGSSAVLGAAPPVMLWAWEEPEDLRRLDPKRAGVAFLADRVFLGRDLRVLPRRQAILTPDGVFAVAVVRMEATAEFADSPELRAETAAAILKAAALPRVRGLQVDFDAASSQREFYADVLRRVRAGMPPGRSLTITALVSWCAEQHGWMADLPVDAAVPMEFRLGKHVGRWAVREPLCAGSLGLATDEPERFDRNSRAGKRIYLFAPGPWTLAQISQVNGERFVADMGGGR
jgi:hypothetical protein